MKPDYSKYSDGLVPAVIQDAATGVVLMLGFMNEDALQATHASGNVTFWSRSKNRLWTKGEESGNFLRLVDVRIDCDNDTLLVKVNPVGPVCHTGANTCWNESNSGDFLRQMERVIQSRKGADPKTSYTAELYSKGINKIAQKVGEEAVELVIEAKDDDREKFLGEAADLLFHYTVLLSAKGFEIKDVEEVLKARHKK